MIVNRTRWSMVGNKAATVSIIHLPEIQEAVAQTYKWRTNNNDIPRSSRPNRFGICSKGLTVVQKPYLNQTGIAQAKLQAENLRNVNFDVCFCSPQTRATPNLRISSTKDRLVFDERLVEINAGEFEGTDETDVEADENWLQASHEWR